MRKTKMEDERVSEREGWGKRGWRGSGVGREEREEERDVANKKGRCHSNAIKTPKQLNM